MYMKLQMHETIPTNSSFLRSIFWNYNDDTSACMYFHLQRDLCSRCVYKWQMFLQRWLSGTKWVWSHLWSHMFWRLFKWKMWNINWVKCRKICEHVCDEERVNSNCTSPNMWTCEIGIKELNSTHCDAPCENCIDGYCEETNDCLCDIGYHMNDNEKLSVPDECSTSD